MAKYSHATSGNILGTEKNTVGTNWHSLNYLRNIAKKSGKDPSGAQVTVRNKRVDVATWYSTGWNSALQDRYGAWYRPFVAWEFGNNRIPPTEMINAGSA